MACVALGKYQKHQLTGIATGMNFFQWCIRVQDAACLHDSAQHLRVACRFYFCRLHAPRLVDGTTAEKPSNLLDISNTEGDGGSVYNN